MNNPQDIVNSARKLIDTPYQHQGRKPNIGCDCIGLPILVAKDLGLGDFDYLEYGRNPDGTLLKKIEDVCQKIVISPGALLVFRISKEAQHCGILTDFPHGGQGLIHAWDIADKVVEHRLADWRKKIVGVYGFPGVNYG